MSEATVEPVGSRGEIVDVSASAPVETPTVIPVPADGKVRAIDKIRAAFADKQWAIDVPEWGLTVYFRPLTMADMEAVQMAKLSDESGDLMSRQVRLLIHKARNADGTPMFAGGDFYSLMNETRIGVLQRVCNFMYACGTLTPGEAKETMGNAIASATTS